jgi:hypothetical protein
MAEVRELVFTIHLPCGCKHLLFNLRAGDRSWSFTIAWDFYRRGKRYPFPVRITPRIHYEANMGAVESDWNDRHKQCCGWTPQSHCGKFEGQ